MRADDSGLTYDRLAKFKARYDSTNLFRFSQNITPAHSPAFA
jgi:hypothetical protein